MAYLQQAVPPGQVEDGCLRIPHAPLLSLAETIIVRIEGVLLREVHAVDGAAAFVRAAGARLLCVSNSSRDTGRTMSGKLRRAGIDVPPERIVIAGEEAVRLIAATYPGARCLVAASRVLSHALRDFGLTPVQRDADVVILGRDSGWTYQRLALIANEVARGAVTVAINPRGASRCEDGRIVPEAGALCASVEAATGKAIAHVVGATGAAMVAAALARLGDPDRAVPAVYIGPHDPARPGGPDLPGIRTLRVGAEARFDAAPDAAHSIPTLADLTASLRPARPARRH